METIIRTTKDEFEYLHRFIAERKTVINVLELEDKGGFLYVKIFYSEPEYLYKMGMAIGKVRKKYETLIIGKKEEPKWKKYITIKN